MNPRIPLVPRNSRAQQACGTGDRPERRLGNRKLPMLSAAVLTAGISFGLAACQDSHSTKPETIIVEPPIPNDWDLMFWDLGIWQD